MTSGSRFDLPHSVELEGSDSHDSGDQSDGIWRLVNAGLVVWLVLNRAIPDLYVLPVGFALRPSQAVLGGVMILLIVANIRSPRPWPFGVPALSGLLLLLVVNLAPFLASGGFDEYQAAGAERGLFYFAIYAVLFISAYQVAQRRQAAILLVKVTVAMTVWQALLTLYEWRSGVASILNWPIWTSFGLAADSIVREALFRPGQLFRPMGTAPHPIVLSSLLAIAILLATILILGAAESRQRILLGIGIVPMAFGMLIVDTRTGFVVLIAGGLAVVLLHARNLPRFLPIALAAMAAFGVAMVVAPDAARSTLNLFWGATSDNSVLLRANRLSSLPELVARNPVLGPGWLTNDPKVLLFDNTYSLGLIELGIVGMAVYVVFLVSSVFRMIASRRLVDDDQDRMLLLAGIAGGIALLVGGVTFDALAFDQFLPTCILLLGIGVATADCASRRNRESRGQGTALGERPG